MSLKLYGHLISQPSRAAAWLMRVKGVNYELVHVAPPTGVTSEFLKMNPNGLVPVLKDGDFSLYEGNAILTYLADKHQWADVYPTELRARAKVNQYLHWHHTNARLSTTQVLRPMLMRERGLATPASIGQLESKDATIAKFTAILEQFFVDKYVAESDHATVADFACYCELDQLEAMDAFDFSKYPKTSEWMKRMKDIPHHDEIRVPMHDFIAKFNLKASP
uniref:GST N-terminal domain-containing protein n=1 Tax=Globisporangium ultimum (strain ATCC 200006 / CBS 805.95 / DAOM BR144) TaxID=431595 RepID=K3W5K7_GLOUD